MWLLLAAEALLWGHLAAVWDTPAMAEWMPLAWLAYGLAVLVLLAAGWRALHGD